MHPDQIPAGKSYVCFKGICRDCACNPVDLTTSDLAARGITTYLEANYCALTPEVCIDGVLQGSLNQTLWKPQHEGLSCGEDTDNNVCTAPGCQNGTCVQNQPTPTARLNGKECASDSEVTDCRRTIHRCTDGICGSSAQNERASTPCYDIPQSKDYPCKVRQCNGEGSCGYADAPDETSCGTPIEGDCCTTSYTCQKGICTPKVTATRWSGQSCTRTGVVGAPSSCTASAVCSGCDCVVPCAGQCGSAAKTYLATDTSFQGQFCAAGNPQPASPAFPGAGANTSWTCAGENGGANSPTCTATKAAQVNCTCPQLSIDQSSAYVASDGKIGWQQMVEYDQAFTTFNACATQAGIEANTAQLYMDALAAIQTIKQGTDYTNDVSATIPRTGKIGSVSYSFDITEEKDAPNTGPSTGNYIFSYSRTIALNGCPVVGQCGSAARTYLANEDAFQGQFCAAGKPQPASPAFPGAGSSTSWTCVGENGGANSSTCTATRADCSFQRLDLISTGVDYLGFKFDAAASSNRCLTEFFRHALSQCATFSSGLSANIPSSGNLSELSLAYQQFQEEIASRDQAYRDCVDLYGQSTLCDHPWSNFLDDCVAVYLLRSQADTNDLTGMYSATFDTPQLPFTCTARAQVTTNDSVCSAAYMYFDNSCTPVGGNLGAVAPACQLSFSWALSPISLVLEGDLAEVSKNISFVKFPLNPSQKDQWYVWRASSKAPLLVYDPTHEGLITSGKQLFGNFTFGGDSTGQPWRHGYEALAVLDKDHDSLLKNEELNELGLWFDNDKNGVSDAGEVKRLDEVGIQQISVASPSLIEHSKDLAVTAGYMRIVDEKTSSGPSIDWYGESASTKQELVARLTKLAEVNSVEDQGKIGHPYPSNAASIHNSLASRIGGAWSWRIDGDSFDTQQSGPVGILSLVHEGGNKVRGHSYIETPFLPGQEVGSLLNTVLLDGTSEVLPDKTIHIHFSPVRGVTPGSEIDTEATLSPADNILKGTTKVRLSYNGQQADFSYNWSATRFK